MKTRENLKVKWQNSIRKLLVEKTINVEQVKEYYLNSGFPRYSEEPFLSEYNDSDWIEHANESELEL